MSDEHSDQDIEVDDEPTMRQPVPADGTRTLASETGIDPAADAARAVQLARQAAEDEGQPTAKPALFATRPGAESSAATPPAHRSTPSVRPPPPPARKGPPPPPRRGTRLGIGGPSPRSVRPPPLPNTPPAGAVALSVPPPPRPPSRTGRDTPSVRPSAPSA
ncbi:MAG: hypothetical protein JRI23_28580, partial [Deltaproteobacteria bacterium]|nr:hypothetical protein [Deltaproteobacteria bacterium]MBW2536055.1 hypothetical protein [Deltaproteobacteria bacterium]